MQNSRTKEKKACFFRHFLSTVIVISVIFLCSDTTKLYFYWEGINYEYS